MKTYKALVRNNVANASYFLPVRDGHAISHIYHKYLGIAII